MLAVTQGFNDSLPPVVRDHLDCEVVDHLEPIVNTHDIEGLSMGGTTTRSRARASPDGSTPPSDPRSRRVVGNSNPRDGVSA